MTPLRNGSEYYKKMLELQERLRRSEEERIRLEERFSMLEHESRSRHETCINRLRMRYIEFLEEQQARDERNHRLLGALDRVDSSLALMSAKTDRLGALRKQYETSVLSSYNNRANGGSVTGDSGVASQRDDKQRRIANVPGGNKNKLFLSDRPRPAYGREKAVTGLADSFGQARYDPRYNGSWSANRYVSLPIGTSHYRQTATGPINKIGGSLSSSINSRDPRGFLNAKTSTDRDTKAQSSPAYDYRFNSPRFAPSEYSLRRPEKTIYASDWRDPPCRTVARDLANSGAYDSFVAPSRSFDNPSRYAQDSFRSERNLSALLSNPQKSEAGARLSSEPNCLGSLKDQLLLASDQPYTRVTEILRQELGDEEEYVGSAVENELERYISKIRNLHRDADPQSVDELDHEQNTSGDLLNVTLSDDGLDFSVEEKPRHRALPQHLGNVLALAKDLADRTATSASNVAASVYRREVADGRHEAGLTGTAADEKLTLVNQAARSADEDPSAVFKADNRFTSVDPVLGSTGAHDDEGRDGTNKKFSLLAKNGFSPEVAKLGTELAPRQRIDIEDVAKSFRNKRDIDDGAVESRLIDKDELDHERLQIFDGQLMRERRNYGDALLTEDSACLRELEDAYRVVKGEEREAGDNLHEITEELEPWNLSALERRVQEIILNDEAQADFVSGKCEVADGSSQERVEQATLDTEAKSLMDKNNMEDGLVGDETVELKGIHKMSLSHTRDEDESGDKLKPHDDSSPAIVDQPIDGSTDEHEEKSKVEGIVLEKSDLTDNLVDSSRARGATDAEKNYIDQENEPTYPQAEYPQDANARYEYTENEEYQGDPNEQYQNYDPSNVQYEQDPSDQYPYGDQQYQPVYTEDSSAQQAYEQDSSAQQAYAQNPSAQQAYAQDPGAQQAYEQDSSAQQAYAQDPSAQQAHAQDPGAQQPYAQDPGAQQAYAQDPSAQQAYAQDPGAQQAYAQDPSAQQAYAQDSGAQQAYAQDPSAQQAYAQDPSAQQAYAQDPNAQQAYAQDPNAQQAYAQDPSAQQAYAQDPNEAYLADTDRQYIADTDQQYAGDSNQQYITDENYEQYVADPNQVYPTGVDQQQYQQEQAYLREDEGPYPATTDDYVYPENQEYASTEVYDPNVQSAPDAAHGYVDEQDPAIAYESQSTLDDGPAKDPSDARPVTEEPAVPSADIDEPTVPQTDDKNPAKKSKDVIKSLLDSDTSSTIEINASNTESDFDFN